jgi:hypothetical protein
LGRFWGENGRKKRDFDVKTAEKMRFLAQKRPKNDKNSSFYIYLNPKMGNESQK